MAGRDCGYHEQNKSELHLGVVREVRLVVSVSCSARLMSIHILFEILENANEMLFFQQGSQLSDALRLLRVHGQLRTGLILIFEGHAKCPRPKYAS